MNKRIHPRFWALLLAICILPCLLTGCVVRPNQELKELVYKAPVEIGLNPGDSLPGTNITFQGVEDSSAVVLIGGQRAIKQKGDSLNWHGKPVEGTEVELNLRIAWYTEEKLYLVGTARVKVDKPVPQVVNIPEDISMVYHAPVAYGIARGALIPGTTISYVGERKEEGAELGGIEGYPYRKSGDSIIWGGKLRDGVYLRMNVRVVHFNASSLRIAGLATISILPQ